MKEFTATEAQFSSIMSDITAFREITRGRFVAYEPLANDETYYSKIFPNGNVVKTYNSNSIFTAVGKVLHNRIGFTTEKFQEAQELGLLRNVGVSRDIIGDFGIDLNNIGGALNNSSKIKGMKSSGTIGGGTGDDYLLEIEHVGGTVTVKVPLKDGDVPLTIRKDASGNTVIEGVNVDRDTNFAITQGSTTAGAPIVINRKDTYGKADGSTFQLTLKYSQFDARATPHVELS